jgi:SP family general alpha glucoside:H+ symporter-like MFS transporter
MESYDVFLIGNFIALPAFKGDFGVINPETGDMLIETKWQSALQVSGQLGALIGVFLAGPLTSRIGYRWATLTGLMLLNVFIFSMYFAKSLPVMFVSQLLEGIPWGIFIANAPAYCSEIVPIQLRAPATQMLQMFWAIGSIIVGAVTYSYNKHEDESAYRYVLVHVSCPMFLTNMQPGSRLRYNGCSLLRSLFSFSSRPKVLGGLFAKGDSRKRRSLSNVLDESRR